MRKYNSKTKRTIMIILIVFVVFIVIFSLFLRQAIKVSKTAYEIGFGSVLYDNDMNKITTENEATIRIKWGGNYYLKYNDNNYNLGKHVVVYNSNNSDMELYGKFYEVNNKGKVNIIEDKNIIKSSVNSKFYKLADRKYLIVDRTIQSDDGSLVTSNYLMVNLDKSGNANLINDKTNLKTIRPTILRTSSYYFDIANEILNFGNEDIDLKKIIGSTNKYDKDTYDLNGKGNNEEENGNKTEDNKENGNGTAGDVNGVLGNGTGNNALENSNGTTGSNNSNYSNNYDSNISNQTVDEIVKATRNTSVIRVTPGIDTINVDYVIYDPDNEYQSVFLEIENTNTSKTNIVYLSKNDTKITVSKLEPNVYYNLTFKYAYNEGSSLKEYTFDSTGVYTKMPKMNLQITKIVDNKIYYKITLDSNYTVSGGVLNLLKNSNIIANSSIPAKGNVKEISGNDCYVDISGLGLEGGDGFDVITLKIVSLSFNTFTINPGVTYKFRY